MVEIDTPGAAGDLPWERLAEEDNVFLKANYVRSWLRHLASGVPKMASSTGADGAACLFPLVDCVERLWGVPVRVWKSLGWNSAWYPYSFLPPESASVEPFFRHLEANRRGWRGVLVTCPGSLQQKVEGEARARGWSTTLWSEKVLPYVTVSGSWERYWNAREKWLRVNVGRFERRAAKQGAVAFRKATSPEECARLLERFVALHDARWSARGQRSKFVTRERHRRFLEDVSRGALERGELYLPYLDLDGLPIAIAVCFRDAGKLYYVWPTFDVEHGRLAPGKLLLYHIIKDAFESGVREVDLGPGSDEYKFYWTEEKRTVAQVFLYRDSLLLWASYRLVPRLRSRVREGIEKKLGARAAARVGDFLDRWRGGGG